jgi:hypothetical protein
VRAADNGRVFTRSIAEWMEPAQWRAGVVAA